MRTIIRTILFALTFSAGACTTDKQTSTSVCEFSFTETDVDVSGLYSKARYVKLEQPNRDAIISNIGRILFIPERIAVVDQDGNKVLLFDEKGNFIKSTSSRIGNGHNEYIRLSDCAADVDNGLFYLCCDAPYQILVLDKDLNFVERIQMDCFFNEMVISGEYAYATVHVYEPTDCYELRRYDKRNFKLPYKVLATKENTENGVMGFGKQLCSDGETVYAAMPMDNNIFTIKNGEIEEQTELDFGERWFAQGNATHASGRAFIEQNQEKIWTIQNICASDSILMFNTNKSGIYHLNKKTMSGIAYRWFTNDNSLYGNSWMTPCCGLKNTTVKIIPPNFVVSLQKDSTLTRTLPEVLKGIKEGDSNLTLEIRNIL